MLCFRLVVCKSALSFLLLVMVPSVSISSICSRFWTSLTYFIIEAVRLDDPELLRYCKARGAQDKPHLFLRKTFSYGDPEAQRQQKLQRFQEYIDESNRAAAKMEMERRGGRSRAMTQPTNPSAVPFASFANIIVPNSASRSSSKSPYQAPPPPLSQPPLPPPTSFKAPPRTEETFVDITTPFTKRKSSRNTQFFGERPPDEIIVDDLERYFPDISKLASSVSTKQSSESLSEPVTTTQSPASVSFKAQSSEDIANDSADDDYPEDLAPASSIKNAIREAMNKRKSRAGWRESIYMARNRSSVLIGPGNVDTEKLGPPPPPKDKPFSPIITDPRTSVMAALKKKMADRSISPSAPTPKSATSATASSAMSPAPIVNTTVTPPTPVTKTDPQGTGFSDVESQLNQITGGTSSVTPTTPAVVTGTTAASTTTVKASSSSTAVSTSTTATSDTTATIVVTESKEPPALPPINNWTKGRLIGQGGFAKVFHALNIDTGEFMAVKQVHFGADSELMQKRKDALKRELELLKEMDHINIVRYLGMWFTDYDI
jgi:hypothetical protein